ncbi:uncharacterized protein LOC101901515 [Musca domestica]|uniref:Uncharacterized protein LOC101901515 n=1 Tax=Musca domestica TaxID=7370 RepID=A0A1I8MG63_MUSDO|nr:uncharacterized protein LOC101901515 [Musca domestica]
MDCKEDSCTATTSTPSTTINDLNDDCLECIFEWIQDLPNQIQIAKCCRRFRNVMLNLWRRQPQHRTLAYNILPTIVQNYDHLAYYLRLMQGEFQILQIIDDCLNVFLKEMEECGIDCLPRVERCEFHDDVTECYPNDEDIECLSRLVPNLKYLQITVPITGRNLSKFQYLEELHLYDDQTKAKEIEDDALRDILLNLKQLRVLDIRNFETSRLRLMPEILQCTSLQVLKINLNTLKDALECVLKLPQLKQLKVLLDQDIDVSLIGNVDTYDYKIYETQEYYHILKEKGPNIKGLAVDFHFLPVSSTWNVDFLCLNPEKLRILALCNYNFTASKYENCCFAHLEILCLRHSENLEAVAILDMLQLCPVLKHLDISYCLNLDKSLLNALTRYLEGEKRSHTLYVYYRMSGLEVEIEKNLSFWSRQKYIKLLNDFPPDSDLGLSYVQRGYAFYF